MSEINVKKQLWQRKILFDNTLSTNSLPPEASIIPAANTRFARMFFGFGKH